MLDAYHFYCVESAQRSLSLLAGPSAEIRSGRSQ